MAHVSWNVWPRKQSCRKGLLFAQAASDYSVGGDSSLYPDATQVSSKFPISIATTTIHCLNLSLYIRQNMIISISQFGVIVRKAKMSLFSSLGFEMF
jgi:hypothetical protein